MKVYLDNDNNNVNIVQSVASASTMISSVAAVARDYIVSKFPKHYFNHIYIDTSETFTQQSYNEKYNKNANKIPYPSLTITPEISLDDPIGGMEKGLHLSSPNLYLRKDINRTYKKLIVDPEQAISVYTTSDYITTNFNFKIVTDTFIKNADIAYFLKSKFQAGFFQYLNDQYIQTEIPKTLIKILANLKGYDLNDPDHMNTLRLYLIGTGKQYDTIKKRRNLSTGRDCFFVNEKNNFLMLFTDLDCPPSINRNSQSEGEYTISFRLQISCWLPNAFIMSINKDNLCKINNSILREVDSDILQQEEGIFTFNITNIKIPKKDSIYFKDKNGIDQIGQLIYDDIFMYNINDDSPTLDVLKYLKSEFTKVYNYIYEKKLDISSLINIKVYDGQSYLSEDNAYLTQEVINKEPKLILHVINDLKTDLGIFIYLNRALYESIKTAMEKDLFYFNDNYITTLYGRIGDITVMLPVKSFINERDLYNRDANKLLRVMTSNGVGYLELDDDNLNSNDDYYKICVGYNDEQPIIKKLNFRVVKES